MTYLFPFCFCITLLWSSLSKLFCLYPLVLVLILFLLLFLFLHRSTCRLPFWLYTLSLFRLICSVLIFNSFLFTLYTLHISILFQAQLPFYHPIIDSSFVLVVLILLPFPFLYSSTLRLSFWMFNLCSFSIWFFSVLIFNLFLFTLYKLYINIVFSFKLPFTTALFTLLVFHFLFLS